MSPEVPQQRTDVTENYLHPPFCRSAFTIVARTRAQPSHERISQLNDIEVALAAGTLTLDKMSLATTELL